MRFICLAIYLMLSTFCANFVDARDDDAKTENVLAGHSYHGEAFNEGPRQQAYLMPGLGRCRFDISTENETAQAFFNQGIDQLHGFWYFEAERSFRQVVLLDPDCAMAHWGLAMANVNNDERAKKFIAEALQKSKVRGREVTPRECLYLDALHAFYDEKTKTDKQRAANFVKKLETIVLKFPDDIEAKAFLACQVWQNKRKGIEITSHIGINAILDEVFDVDPDHPAHHYRIHLWDYENAEVALQSAALCGPSLPDIAHMWHMPGHIYSRLHRYEDAVWQQEASARVDHRNMMRDWVLPDQIHNFAHNNEWLIRNLIHVGRVRDAVDLATNMISLPRHPKYNLPEKTGSSSYGRKRLFQTYSTFEMWDELIDACQSPVLADTNDELDNIKRLRVLGRAYYRSGQAKQGKTILEQLERERTRTEAAKSITNSETRIEHQRLTQLYYDMGAHLQKFIPERFRKTGLENFRNNIRRNHRTRRTTALNKAVKPFDDEINVINRAIDELTGYALINTKEYKLAVTKFEKAGQVDAIYRAYVRHLGGETEEAIKLARKHVNSHKNEVQPLTMLTWLLWETGKRHEALESLCQLFEISGSIDLESSFFDRIEPVLEFGDVDGDWRISTMPNEDIGERPDLDSLGPFRWQPAEAPGWRLLDSNEETVSLSQYSGRPVVVIFYLGHGCLHCAEQLQKFAPQMQDFRDAGIEMLAISTDARDGLKTSIESYGSKPLPLKLVANPEMDIFKKYRVYDEFENQPLHGTFLIDRRGRIRWQDISYEPFMDVDFLLQEAKRLLACDIDNQSAH